MKGIQILSLTGGIIAREWGYKYQAGQGEHKSACQGTYHNLAALRIVIYCMHALEKTLGLPGRRIDRCGYGMDS